MFPSDSASATGSRGAVGEGIPLGVAQSAHDDQGSRSGGFEQRREDWLRSQSFESQQAQRRNDHQRGQSGALNISFATTVETASDRSLNRIKHNFLSVAASLSSSASLGSSSTSPFGDQSQSTFASSHPPASNLPSNQSLQRAVLADSNSSNSITPQQLSSSQAQPSQTVAVPPNIIQQANPAYETPLCPHPMFHPLSYSYPYSYSLSTLSQDGSLGDSIAGSGAEAKSFARSGEEAPPSSARLKKKLSQIELSTRLHDHRQPQVKIVLPEFTKVLIIASKVTRLRKFDPPSVSGRSQNLAKGFSSRSKSFENSNSVGAGRSPKPKKILRESLIAPEAAGQLGDYAKLSDFDQMLAELDDDDRMVTLNVVVKYFDFKVRVNKLWINSMKTVKQLKLCVANEVPTGKNSALKFAEASKVALGLRTLPDHIRLSSVPGFESGKLTLKFLVGEEVNLNLRSFESSPPSENQSDSEKGEILLPPPARGSDQRRIPDSFASRAEGSSGRVENQPVLTEKASPRGSPLGLDPNLSNIDAASESSPSAEIRPLPRRNVELVETEEVSSDSSELVKVELVQPRPGNPVQIETHQPAQSASIELETNQPEIRHSMRTERIPLDTNVAAVIDRFRMSPRTSAEVIADRAEPISVATGTQRDFGSNFLRAAAGAESAISKKESKDFPEMQELWTPGAIAKFFPKLTKKGYRMQPPADFLKTKVFEELREVQRFAVENEFGSIEWETPVDLIGVDLNRAVSICPDGVEVFPRCLYDDEEKPPRGSGLNGPAIVSIRGIRFADSNSRTMEEFVDELKETCQRIGAEFVEYFFGEGILRYRIFGGC